jgi:signal transduction histidine kinase
MREYTTDYLEDFHIDLKYRIQEELPHTPIKKECHRELFMVVKEILNNVSKHSHATEVCFSASLSEDIFKISIKDNGIGFNINTVNKGNGLHNIKHRIESNGGVFNITSDSSGTEICFLMANEKLLKN